MTSRALAHVKRSWADFLRARPGERFELFHEEHNRSARPWKRPLYIVLAFASLTVAIVLVFVPGPAILFFALSAALCATQSRWVAHELDLTELKFRDWAHALRHRSRRV